MSADIGLVLPNTPVGRVLHAALVRGYLTRIQAEEIVAWSDWSEQSPTPGLDRMAEEAGDDPAQAATASSPARPTAAERARFWQQPTVEVNLRLNRASIARRLLAMLEGAAPDGPAPQEPDDLNPARMLRLTEAQAGRFFLAVCHAYGPLTPARLAGWLAGEED
jgi:hypothetical protein